LLCGLHLVTMAAPDVIVPVIVVQSSIHAMLCRERVGAAGGHTVCMSAAVRPLKECCCSVLQIELWNRMLSCCVLGCLAVDCAAV
jgi:hypothetical protein